MWITQLFGRIDSLLCFPKFVYPFWSFTFFSFRMKELSYSLILFFILFLFAHGGNTCCPKYWSHRRHNWMSFTMLKWRKLFTWHRKVYLYDKLRRTSLWDLSYGYSVPCYPHCHHRYHSPHFLGPCYQRLHSTQMPVISFVFNWKWYCSFYTRVSVDDPFVSNLPTIVKTATSENLSQGTLHSPHAFELKTQTRWYRRDV